MDEILTQDLKKQFDTLPIEVQKAISSIDLPTKLQEIVKNNKLMIDQAGSLEIETILVLFGLEPQDNYVSNLIKNVGLSNIQASMVAHDVNELIFKGIRESLKKMSDQILETDKVADEETVKNVVPTHDELPSQETVLAGIENPEKIKANEESVSISSLQSNSTKPEIHETISKGIETRQTEQSFGPVKINNLPEIAPKAILPIVSSLTPKPIVSFHQNIAPINNIVESKLTSTVTVPKENIIIEEKTKLPEKLKSAGDPYRESII